MAKNLKRFLDAQDKKYPVIYADVLSRKYNSGWLEFVLPRFFWDVPSSSHLSETYGFTSLSEAECYWNNKLLRTNMLEIMKLFLKYSDDELKTVLPDRARVKILACAGTFVIIDRGKEFDSEHVLQDIIKRFLKFC